MDAYPQINDNTVPSMRITVAPEGGRYAYRLVPRPLHVAWEAAATLSDSGGTALSLTNYRNDRYCKKGQEG
ncbi:predicted protein [Botrytis cinerea T4]|uniref:Uncharacterized protein n=1 Tax=Botryotinia fuckeliana (strain T4) TaxID=999810 RepID=G2YAV3_BOTF4|nr:predicted protein [Botrytis cinerea T4]